MENFSCCSRWFGRDPFGRIRRTRTWQEEALSIRRQRLSRAVRQQRRGPPGGARGYPRTRRRERLCDVSAASDELIWGQHTETNRAARIAASARGARLGQSRRRTQTGVESTPTKMASLVKLCKFAKPLASKNTGLFWNAVRTKVYSHEDFKPGPYPKTEEQRRKAAEKYGLHPDEYEPYPDDGAGLGDYPKLPMIGQAARDVNYPWDDPSSRRNLHETMHKHVNIMGDDRVDFGVEPPVPYWVAWSMFTGAVSIVVLMWWIFDSDQDFHPVMQKQMPKPGVVHYTFEPAR